MISHVSLSGTDLSQSKALYDVMLKPLGYSLLMDLTQYGALGYGNNIEAVWYDPSLPSA